MNIQQLEYILAVDTYRHFAKAAEHCRVTQPTLSMMIQKLEDELGVKLFDRNIQPVCPTPAGRKVIDQARVVLYQTSLIKDIVNEEEQSLKGTFRLAVLPTIAPYLLPRFFQQVSEKHPDLDIRILEMQTAPTTKALLNGEIDAAIIANQPTEVQLQGDILYYEQFYAYVARNESVFKKEMVRSAENPHGKDHSAFIGFAPYRNPKVAICVYVENGGFGATYGVPIGKLMMEKYLKGEISEENKLLEETMSNAVVSPNVLSLPNREL